MPKTSGEPNPIQSGVESENSADLDQASGGSVSQEEETAANQISAPPEGPGESKTGGARLRQLRIGPSLPRMLKLQPMMFRKSQPRPMCIFAVKLVSSR